MTALLAARRARIASLSERASHARQLLSTLDALLTAQEHVSGAVDRASVSAPSLSDVGFGGFAGVGRDFLQTLVPSLTVPLQTAAAALSRQPTAWKELLQSTARRESLVVLSRKIGCDEAALRFFGEALLQPIARASREQQSTPGAQESGTRHCPHCAWPPIAALLKDTASLKGQRTLVCALCDAEYPTARVACANCGETSSAQLTIHESDRHPHIRIDTCKRCGAYLKTIDLRKDGRADALVDDVASVELDLWAAEQKLWKVQRNVLGL